MTDTGVDVVVIDLVVRVVEKQNTLIIDHCYSNR
jgi:hypothetical protein